MERQVKMTGETIEPLCGRVLFCKDDDKGETKGGIILPDTTKIPTISGRIVAIAADVEANDEIPIRQYDKVLVNPGRAIPVEFEGDNKLFIVPVEDLVAVVRKPEQDDD
jgi:chaperonin GroES